MPQSQETFCQLLESAAAGGEGGGRNFWGINSSSWKGRTKLTKTVQWLKREHKPRINEQFTENERTKLNKEETIQWKWENKF